MNINTAHLAYYANLVLEQIGMETEVVAFWQDLWEIDLKKKSTREEYEANKEAIRAYAAATDAVFIFEELGMTNWREFCRDSTRLIAECKPTEAMWQLWKFDRIQIKKRSLQPRKTDQGYIVECYSPLLSDLLIACSA